MEQTRNDSREVEQIQETHEGRPRAAFALEPCVVLHQVMATAAIHAATPSTYVPIFRRLHVLGPCLNTVVPCATQWIAADVQICPTVMTTVSANADLGP